MPLAHSRLCCWWAVRACSYGTASIAAPELLLEGRLTKSSDIYGEQSSAALHADHGSAAPCYCMHGMRGRGCLGCVACPCCQGAPMHACLRDFPAHCGCMPPSRRSLWHPALGADGLQACIHKHAHPPGALGWRAVLQVGCLRVCPQPVPAPGRLPPAIAAAPAAPNPQIAKQILWLVAPLKWRPPVPEGCPPARARTGSVRPDAPQAAAPPARG